MSGRTVFAVSSVLFAFGVAPAHAITSSTQAPDGSWPWTVQVYALSGTGDVEAYCAGTLVDTRRVITAASCFQSSEPDVVFGGTQTFTDETHGVSEVVSSEEFPGFVHEGEDPDLMELTLAVSLDDATPVPVLAEDETDEVDPGDKALIAGWGGTSSSSTDFESELREAQVTLSNTTACSGLEPDYLCSVGDPAACFGDSGGPLLVRVGADSVAAGPTTANGPWRLAGVISFGGGCEDFTAYASLATAQARAFASEAPRNTAAPSVDGTAEVGSTLTCSPGTWTNAQTFAYEWLRDGAVVGSGPTYTVVDEDAGHTVTCRVTATNEEGASTKATSSSSAGRVPAPAGPPPPPPGAPPTPPAPPANPILPPVPGLDPANPRVTLAGRLTANGRSVRVTVRNANPFALRGTATLLAVRSARAAARLGPRKAFTVAATASKRVTVRLSPRARRALRRSGRLRARIRVVVRDAASTSATVSRRLTLRRRR
ncbi:MAG TPA: trypsin-like serine protease [Solirubrobacteraceae bacterium]|jgi:hypothetical protein